MTITVFGIQMSRKKDKEIKYDLLKFKNYILNQRHKMHSLI